MKNIRRKPGDFCECSRTKLAYSGSPSGRYSVPKIEPPGLPDSQILIEEAFNLFCCPDLRQRSDEKTALKKLGFFMRLRTRSVPRPPATTSDIELDILSILRCALLHTVDRELDESIIDQEHSLPLSLIGRKPAVSRFVWDQAVLAVFHQRKLALGKYRSRARVLPGLDEGGRFSELTPQSIRHIAILGFCHRLIPQEVESSDVVRLMREQGKLVKKALNFKFRQNDDNLKTDASRTPESRRTTKVNLLPTKRWLFRNYANPRLPLCLFSYTDIGLLMKHAAKFSNAERTGLQTRIEGRETVKSAIKRAGLNILEPAIFRVDHITADGIIRVTHNSGLKKDICGNLLFKVSKTEETNRSLEYTFFCISTESIPEDYLQNWSRELRLTDPGVLPLK